MLGKRRFCGSDSLSPSYHRMGWNIGIVNRVTDCVRSNSYLLTIYLITYLHRPYVLSRMMSAYPLIVTIRCGVTNFNTHENYF